MMRIVVPTELRPQMNNSPAARLARAIKEGNPEFGIKRVWSTLKESNGFDVSEKRVKKVTSHPFVFS
jgi:hypothetical protein